jgi:hypothetical protein
MAKVELGRLQVVDPREVWPSEASDFTPWLALPANLALLGETLGMELELEAQEQEVGPFRADILCRETGSGNWVLIENQLEKTDHTHLGQLMTYAAGLKAVTVVWVARQFTEEHRAALDWLNEITAESFEFFGIEVEVLRIGDSLHAPNFKLVSKPNDWTREVSGGATRIRGGELSESGKRQLEFWTDFRKYAEQHARRFKPVQPLAQTWTTIALGRSDFRLYAAASTWNSVLRSYDTGEIRVELEVDRRDHFGRLKEDKERIERELPATLDWQFEDGRKRGRVRERRDADLSDKAKWPEYHAWLTERLDRFHEVFRDRVMAMPRGSAARSDE